MRTLFHDDRVMVRITGKDRRGRPEGSVVEVLERNNGNRTQTARDLGVDPRTIFRYLEKEQNPIPSGAGGTSSDRD